MDVFYDLSYTSASLALVLLRTLSILIPQKTWWDQIVANVMMQEPNRIHKMLRVSISTFMYPSKILESSLETSPPLAHQKIAGPRVLDVQKPVAITLQMLGTGDSLIFVGELFGVAKPTAHKILNFFVKALIVKAHTIWNGHKDRL